jgi:uncharacterized protein (DUF924 family)
LSSVTYKDILAFWFEESSKKRWFNATPEFDDLIRINYQDTWKQASNGELFNWQETDLGCLALTIILDQFPLNMFRGTAKSFSTETNAIAVTRHAIHHKFDLQLSLVQQPFLYLPLMHSENLEDQNESVRLFEKARLANNLRFAKHHQSIIKTYGRFPHRNEILNRMSTSEELDYLASPAAFKG